MNDEEQIDNPYPDVISDAVWTKALKATVEYVSLGVEYTNGRNGLLSILNKSFQKEGRIYNQSSNDVELIEGVLPFDTSLPRKDTYVVKDRQGINTLYYVWNTLEIHNIIRSAFLNSIVKSSTGNTYSLSAWYPPEQCVCCQGSMHGICNHAAATLKLLRDIEIGVEITEKILLYQEPKGL